MLCEDFGSPVCVLSGLLEVRCFEIARNRVVWSLDLDDPFVASRWRGPAPQLTERWFGEADQHVPKHFGRNSLGQVAAFKTVLNTLDPHKIDT